MKHTKKNLKGFILEMILLVTSIAIILVALLYNELLVIKIHILTIATLIIILSMLIYLYCNIINLGIKALCDFIIPGYARIQGTYINEYPFTASMFTDKWDKKHKIKTDIRYYIVIKNLKNEYLTLISPVYQNLEKSKRYTFYVGKCSGIILAFDE